ncbi:MAG: PAS domain S-box protein [Pseudomonadota bacterium]|nr:PAS domain S-box protein [Pseudomonadota bacterium]
MTKAAVLPVVDDLPSASRPFDITALRRRVVRFASLLYITPFPLWIAVLWAGELLTLADTPRYVGGGMMTILPMTILFYVALDGMVRRAFRPAEQLMAATEPDEAQLQRISRAIGSLPARLMRGQVTYGLLAPPVAAIGYRALAPEPVALAAPWPVLELMALLVMVIPSVVLLDQLSHMLVPIIERTGVRGMLAGGPNQLRQQLLLSAVGLPLLTMLLFIFVTLQREGIASAANLSLIGLASTFGLICLYGVWAISRHFGESLQAVRRVAETGDLTETIPVHAVNEFGVMAIEFNRMLRRLRETEQGRDYVETLLASVGDALLVVDADHRVRRANGVSDSWWEATHPDGVLGKPVGDLFNTDTCAVRNAVDRCLSDDIVREHLDVVITPSDTVRHLQLTLSSVAGADERPSCLILARDVTVAVQQRRDLEASEGRYRTLAENDAVAIYRIDLKGRIEYANRKLRSLLGFDSENAVTGARVTDFVSDADAATIERNLAHRGRGESTIYEIDLRTVQGESRRMLASGAPLHGDSGEVTGSVGMMVDISELAEARRALAASEAKYRALAETSAAGIYQVDPDGTAIYLNRAMAELLGYESPDDAIGSSIIDMMTADSRAQVARYRTLREQGKASSYEIQLTDRRGRVRRLTLHGAPVMDSEGRYSSAIGVAIDITEQVAVRERLVANEARFRALAETSGAAILQMDYVGHILYANEAARDLFGIDPGKSLEDCDWHQFIPGESVERVTAEQERRRRGNGSTYQIELVARDGQRRQVLVSGAPVTDADGVIRSAIQVIVDVSEREAALERLRESEGRYRALAEHALAGIWQIGNRGETLYLNPAMRRMIEVSSDTRLEDIHFREFIADGHLDITDEQHHQRAQGVATANYELTIVGSKGARHEVLISGAGVYADSGELTSMVGSFIDVTELRHAMETIREQIVELEQKNRELEEFNYVASHDLQEPLRTIISFGELLREDLDGEMNPRAEEDLAFITAGAERLRVLVQDLLELSRSGRRRLDEDIVALDDCVAAAVADLSLFVKESGAQVTSDDLPVVKGNARALTRIFTNLISNGIKFGNTEQPWVTISCDARDNWVEVTVRDNGIGISAEHLEQIFQPFKRLHSRTQYEGSGIGLAICQRLVESHGGRIWAESDGNGSAMHLTLPLAPELTESDSSDL